MMNLKKKNSKEEDMNVSIFDDNPHKDDPDFQN
jgi:hypothetical protein